MNKGFFIGNLTSDPVSRSTPNGKTVTNFSIAVSSGWGENKKTDYIQVAAWGALGENCAKYLAKGKKALIVGAVGVTSYTTKTGEHKAAITVTAHEIEFLTPSSSNSGEQGYPKGDVIKAQGGEAPAATAAQGGFTDISNTYSGDDFPF